ncbi:MAG: hypothetical protein NTW74_05555 [Acidobacteria bacterium]|nr:hypothetical protein [Acidobacteriota bacterium]
MQRLISIPFILFSALCLWNSLADFWAAYRTRVVQASVIASKLKIDWGHPDSESGEEPLYTLSVDLKADDGSGRTFSWEGDAGRAMYPEEALDEFERWQPGRKHSVGMLRGNAKEIRLDQMESNPEVGKGVGWLFGFCFSAITALASLVAVNMDSKPHPRLAFMKGFGVWTVFLAFGLMPLLGSFAFAWGMSQKLNTWKPVVARKVGEQRPFDTSKPIANVEITSKAMVALAEKPYNRIEFNWKGQTLHGGIGPWRGTYDTGTLAAGDNYYFVGSPNDRWEIAPSLSWREDFGVPFGILLFFGLAFTGASLIVKRSERSF